MAKKKLVNTGEIYTVGPITERDAFRTLRNNYVQGIVEHRMVLLTIEGKPDTDVVGYQQLPTGDGEQPMSVQKTVGDYKKEVNTKIEQFVKLIGMVDKVLKDGNSNT